MKRILSLFIVVVFCTLFYIPTGFKHNTSKPITNSETTLATTPQFVPDISPTLKSLHIIGMKTPGSLTFDNTEKLYSYSQKTHVGSNGIIDAYEATMSLNEPSIRVKRKDTAYAVTLTSLGYTNHSVKQDHSMLVYQTPHGTTTVIRPTAIGIKEDIIVTKPEHVDHTPLRWRINIAKETEARMMKNGSVGIYGPNQMLWGDIQIGDEESRALLEFARKKAAKTELLYTIPAPVIVDKYGKNHRDISTFELTKDNLLTIKNSEQIKKLAYPISIDPSVIITTTAEFDLGNLEGMISTAGAKLSRGRLTAGRVIVPWNTATPLPTGRHYHASIVYNNKIYVIGGWNGTAVTNAIHCATINPTTGALGAWTALATLPSGVMGHAAAVWNGYVYISGGTTGSGALTNVYYAKINPTTGAIGPWTGTTGLSIPRYRHTMVATNNMLIVIGGSDNAGTPTLTASVSFIKIKADGSLDLAWTPTTPLPQARAHHATVIYKDIIYVIAGVNTANAETNFIYYAKLDFGAVTPIPAGAWCLDSTSLGSVLYKDPSASVFNGFLYVSGGYDTFTSPTTVNKVILLKILISGALHSFDYPPASLNMLVATSGHTSFTLNGFVYAIGGANGSALATTQFARIQAAPAVGPWQAGGGSITARKGHASAIYRGYLYISGGFDSGVFNDVQKAQIFSNGSIGAFGSTGGTITGRWGHTMFAYNNIMYVIGGFSDPGMTAALAQVQCGTIDASGQIGSWFVTTPLTLGVGFHAMVVCNQYVYIIGGASSGPSPTSTVYRGLIDLAASGGIVSWSVEAALPSIRYGHAASVHNRWIYVTGGGDGANVFNSVWKIQIGLNGLLTGSWDTVNPTFSTPRGHHKSIIFNSTLYIFGGDNGSGTSYADIQYATINLNGSLNPWQSSGSFASARSYHTVNIHNGHLIIVAGSGASVFGDAQYATINHHGGTGSFAGAGTGGSYSPPRYTNHTSVIWNGYVYIIGGYDMSISGPIATIIKAQIQKDGNLTAWVNSGPTFTGPRYDHTSFVSADRIYILGGRDSTVMFNDVQFTTIVANGTTGVWVPTTSFPINRYAHTTVYHNDFVYVIGGTTNLAGNAFTPNIEFAPVNTDGTIGTWTTATALPFGIGFHSTAFYSGYIYVIGGQYVPSGSDDKTLNTVYRIGVNADGTLAPGWSRLNDLPTRSFNNAAVALNGVLYVIGGETNIGGASFIQKDVFASAILSDGNIGKWYEMPNLISPTSTHTVNEYTGILYMVYDGLSFTQIERADLNTPCLVGQWSQLIDLGLDDTVTDIVINGSPSFGPGKYEVKIATSAIPQLTAFSNGGIPWGGSIPMNTTARYIFISVKFDDSLSHAWNADSPAVRDVLDITVNHGVAAPPPPAAPPPAAPPPASPPPATGPLPAPLSVTATAGNGNISLSWGAVTGASSYRVYYGTSPGVYLPMSVSTGTVFTIVGLQNGVTYYIAISTVDSASVEGSKSAEIAIFLPLNIATHVRSLPGGLNPINYRIISFPVKPTSGHPETNLADNLGSYNNTIWRLFYWDPLLQAFIENPAPGVADIDYGRAYFIISKVATTIDVTGVLADSGADFSIVLQPGWNLVGHPFNFPVDWAKVRANGVEVGAPGENGLVLETLWDYVNDYAASNRMVTSRGYFIKNLSSGPVVLTIPAIAAADNGLFDPNAKSTFVSTDVSYASKDERPPAPPGVSSKQDSSGGGGGGGGGCYIATASYGNVSASEVLDFTSYRSMYLDDGYSPGQAFTSLYEDHAPIPASYIGKSRVLQSVSMSVLNPLRMSIAHPIVLIFALLFLMGFITLRIRRTLS